MSEQTKCVRKGDLGCTHDGECETPPMSELTPAEVEAGWQIVDGQKYVPAAEAARLREALRGFTEAVENSPHGECFDRKSPTYLRTRVVLGDTPDE
jgi:hypothetical protein